MIALILKGKSSPKTSYMIDDALAGYIERNGKHFTDKLAEFASKQMDNTDKSTHYWSSEDVQKAFSINGYIKPANRTWGDVSYIANMAYADFYGMVFKNETDCLKYALADINDIDGYEGKEFCRWLADVTEMGLVVDWDNM